ncbi:MAG TPA: hypothetical protein VNL77_20065, partial [Roseiflexaceae bacterium]|nr:hypothetical protein [Roseiflexaceae bacterium]
TRYHDAARQVEVWADLRLANDQKLRSRVTRDQLGRAVLSETSENGSSYTLFTQTVYEQLGRITYTRNPSRSIAASTDGWTRTARDEIGRVVEVATFAGAAKPSVTATNWNGRVTTAYNAEQTTVTDQAGKTRRSDVDGLGRLVKVVEDPGGLHYETTYSYDALDSLTGVSQGSQARTFSYDSLSRLRSATNPESGTVSYGYDAAGNLASRGDGRGVVTSYTYDGLHRVKTRSYSDGTPAVTYSYDSPGANARGRLVQVASSVSRTEYLGYDAAGRVSASRQTTAGVGYDLSYGYDVAGHLTSQTYPSGRRVLTNFDDAARISQVRGTKSGEANKTYASGLSYAAHGGVAAMALGNGLGESMQYNARLQPTQVRLAQGAAEVLRLDYSYGSTTNNGNVLSQRIVGPGLDRTQSYGYDALNRLASASEAGAWSRTFAYDRYGNGWVSSFTGITPGLLTPRAATDFSTSSNRITLAGFFYDAAGNLTNDNTGAALAYDG